MLVLPNSTTLFYIANEKMQSAKYILITNEISIRPDTHYLYRVRSLAGMTEARDGSPAKANQLTRARTRWRELWRVDHCDSLSLLANHRRLPALLTQLVVAILSTAAVSVKHSNAALLFLQLRTNILLMLRLGLKKSNETRRY